MTTAEAPEPDFNVSRPEAPSFRYAFLYDDLQTLFKRHHFYGIDRQSAVLGGTLADFWDEGEDAEVSVVNTISCTEQPETYIFYLRADGSFVAIHSQGGAARWCTPGAPLLNDEEVRETMNDIEFTQFDEATSRSHLSRAHNRVSAAWRVAFLEK